MPKVPIPQYTAQQAPNGVVRGGAPSAVDLSGLTHGLTSASDTFQRLQQHQEMQRQQLAEDEAKVFLANKVSEGHSTMTERLAAAKQSATDGAPGFTAGLLKDFDQWSTDAVKGAPELAKKPLEMRLAELRTGVHEHAFTFETGARQKKLIEDYSTGLDADRRTVQADPSQFTTLLAGRIALANSLMLPPDLKAKTAEVTREHMAYDAGAGMANNDPGGFLARANDPKQVNSDPVLSSLKPENLSQLRNHASALIAQRQAKDAALSDKAYKEAQTATEELRKFWIAGAVPDLNYQNEVLRKVTGTAFESGARDMIDQATKGAAHGAAPLPRQEASIRAMEAEFAKASNPEAEKLLTYARQVTETQKKEYKENPWAAGARFGRQQSVPDAPLQSPDMAPDYVKQVLPLMDGIESMSGMPASPLQPDQAHKFSQQLKALPPGPRADILGRVGEQLSAPRIGALADQLDKYDRPLSLALKLGAGRTSIDRAVQETMLRGADAIRDKTVKADDTKLTGWRANIAAMVRGTLGDAQAEQDVIDAAYYTRAGMDEPGYPAKANEESAVKLIIGQPIERAGVKTILPKGMDEGQFVDKLRAYTPERLRELVPTGTVYVRGQPRSVEQLASTLPSIGLRRDEHGRYLPVSGGVFVSLDPGGQMPLALEVR